MIDYFALAAQLARQQAQVRQPMEAADLLQAEAADLLQAEAADLLQAEQLFIVDGEETDAWERTIERQDVPEGEEWENEEEASR